MSESYSVRNLKRHDFPMLLEWWRLSGESPPTLEMMPEESSFILEINQIPVLAVTLYLTNSDFAWADNFIGNPTMKGVERRNGSTFLSDYCGWFAFSRGYKRLFCFAYKDALKNRYEQLGFTQTLSGVTGFTKELE